MSAGWPLRGIGIIRRTSIASSFFLPTSAVTRSQHVRTVPTRTSCASYATAAPHFQASDPYKTVGGPLVPQSSRVSHRAHFQRLRTFARHCSCRRGMYARDDIESSAMDASKGREVLPTNVTPTHYDLKLDPDLVKHTYNGVVSIE